MSLSKRMLAEGGNSFAKMFLNTEAITSWLANYAGFLGSFAVEQSYYAEATARSVSPAASAKERMEVAALGKAITAVQIKITPVSTSTKNIPPAMGHFCSKDINNMKNQMFEEDDGRDGDDSIDNHLLEQLEELSRGLRRDQSKVKKIMERVAGGPVRKKPHRNRLLDSLVKIGAILAGYHLRNQLVGDEYVCRDVEEKLRWGSPQPMQDLADAVFILDELFYKETGHVLSSCITPHSMNIKENPTRHFLDTAKLLGALTEGSTKEEQYSCWVKSADFYRSIGDEKFINFLKQKVQPLQTQECDVPALIAKENPPRAGRIYEEDPEWGNVPE
jgi:hypothetical protein